MLSGLVLLSVCVGVWGMQWEEVKGWPQWPKGTNFSRVTAMAVNVGEETVSVLQRGIYAAPIYDFSLDGAYKGDFGDEVITSGHGMRFQQNSFTGGAVLWVTDVGGHFVHAFFPNGTTVLRLGTGRAGNGTDPLEFDQVADVTFSPDDSSTIYIVDGDGGLNNRLMAVEVPSGRVKWVHGAEAGNSSTLFSVPHSVDFQHNPDRLWVADRTNGRLVAIAPEDGSYIGEWVNCVSSDGGLPWGVRVDAVLNVLHVADGNAGRILTLQLDSTKPLQPPNTTKPQPQTPLPPCNVLANTPALPITSNAHEMAVNPRTHDIYLAMVGDPTYARKYQYK